MNTHDTETANKIITYLDQGAASLKAGTAYRLQQARAAALARIGAPALVPGVRMQHALAGAGANAVGGSPRFGGSSLRWWVGVAAFVVVAGFGWQQWKAVQQVREFEELDAQILSSDLPIDAYLDRGFQNWLKASFEP
ncbi:MAG: DUF3619 family protein [Casimicrobiaceae bacterium]